MQGKKNSEPKPIDHLYEKRGPNECWPWVGCIHEMTGYGLVHREHRCQRAHRYVVKAPKGSVVRHTCDNRRCVNPAHLIVGTQHMNLRDSVKRGRWHQTKISEETVGEIRDKYEAGEGSHRSLATEYGLSKSQIGHIVRREQRVDKCPT